MRLRGIHYDVGTATLDGTSTRPVLSPDRIEREIADIAGALHANAVRITGGDVDRLAIAGEAAAGHGLEAWLSPMLPNADAPTTLSAIEDAARVAEDLRRAGHASVLVVGCELSAFMAGILPGDDPAARIGLLSDMTRLVAAVSAAGYDPQQRFDAFLADAVRVARGRFAGPLSYAAGTWEQVDWSSFDIVGVDAYRDAGNRDGYLDLLRTRSVPGKPLVITEFGCATYRGAADPGGIAWNVLERGAEPRLRDGIVRDEAAQAEELEALLDLAGTAGVDGAFVYTYIAPSYPSGDDPAHDLDAASYALVRSWPDGRTERKAAFDVVAAHYGRADR